MDTDGLEQRIGYRFKKKALLSQALTHRSHGQPNNERLEFLGDSVLNCAIATVLFERFPDVDEGDLSRLRAYLVKQLALHNVAQRLALGEHLVLGEGESRSGGTRRPSILADALEALIGAVYLDAGFEAAKALIDRLYEPELKDADPLTLGKDAKTLLQEELQRNRMPLPVYEVVATHGAAHSQVFDVECVISRLDVRVLGTGGSRRAAEQAAADAALKALASAGSGKVRKAGSRKKTRKASVKARAKAANGRRKVTKEVKEVKETKETKEATGSKATGEAAKETAKESIGPKDAKESIAARETKADLSESPLNGKAVNRDDAGKEAKKSPAKPSTAASPRSTATDSAAQTAPATSTKSKPARRAPGAADPA